MVPTLDTQTRVMILQHPRERDVPIGTARMASLCLPNAKLHVGARWDDPAIFADPARTPILLYPGPGAKDILTDPPVGPVTLVVVDGTWSQAKTVVRDNPILRALPRYAFHAPEPSDYRIRKEPSEAYCSTIEALMHVLGALEGDPAKFRALLAPFRAMVDFQLACQAERPSRRVRQERAPKPPRRRVPDEVIDRFADLVCVVGETNAWPYHGDVQEYPDEIVHWVAERVATGERFEAIAAPQNPLSPSTTFHIDLDEATLRAGGTRAELFASFERFVRPSDIVCAWGDHSLGLYRSSGGVLPELRFDLRAVAKRAENRRIGALEAYGETHVTEGGRRGRAHRRLALLVAAARKLAGVTLVG